jgi:hypothetical protein
MSTKNISTEPTAATKINTDQIQTILALAARVAAQARKNAEVSK